MSLRTCPAEVRRAVMDLAIQRTPAGSVVSKMTMQIAYDIVWATAAMDTALWKCKNLTIGEYRK